METQTVSLAVLLVACVQGHITLNTSETAQEITIDVIENQSVKFECAAFAILNVRPPGSSLFGTNTPGNLIVRGELTTGLFTFEFQNVTQSDNGTSFQCRGGGGFTDIGVTIVLFPPSQPRNVSIQSMDIGPTYARVCWQPPSSRGIPTVSRYVITATPVNESADPLTFNTPDATRDFNVTGLAPGTRYEFRVSAISEAEMVVLQSFPSDPFSATTNLTVPAPVCPTPPTSSDGVITIYWNYTHTGGLELTRVIVTATKGTLSIELDVPNGNLTDPSQTYLNINTFTAGFQYIFGVTAYNELGSSSVQCDPVMHLIGVPQIPEIPYGVSSSPGSITLTIRTPVSGRMSSQIFLFIVNFTQTSDGMEGSRTLEASDYIDGEDCQFTIDGLMEGEQYVFSAQARNQFGSSDFSGNSDFITINAQPSTVQTITIGVAVGIAVVTGIIAFVVGAIVGVLLYHCISKHRSAQLKPESSSYQQQQTEPEYEMPATSGEEKLELRDNVAYLPVRH